MKIKQRITGEWKTTATGLFLIIFSLLDKWYFKSFEAEILNVDVHIYSIGLGCLLIIMKDKIITWIENKLK